MLTRPVQATNVDIDPGRLYSSPAMAVDPKNPLRIVGGWADLRTRRCGIIRSTDGGRRWVRPDASPNTATFPFCSQSQGGVIQAPVVFGGDGMLYMALNGWGTEEAARTGGAIMVARSSDLGDSWQTTVVRNAPARKQGTTRRTSGLSRASPSTPMAVTTAWCTSPSPAT